MISCTVDDNVVDVCPDDFSPTINSDVSGIGVRISFYVQALLLACLSARARSLDEITGALYTLIATNMAMAVTSLILGFKPNPTLTFHDSLIVFYLLALSWASVFFSLPTYNRFVKSDKTLQLLSIIQSYLLFAYAIAILIKAQTFGPSWCCNGTAKVALFRPFSALRAGRIVGWVVVVLVVVIYTVLSVYDYWPLATRYYRRFKSGKTHLQRFIRGIRKGKQKSNRYNARSIPMTGRNVRSDSPQNDLEATPEAHSSSRRENGLGGRDDSAHVTSETGNTGRRRTARRQSTGLVSAISERIGNVQAAHGYDLGLAGNLIIELVVIAILWGLMVMNTELMIVWNNFQESTDWQFGQILPMFLIVLPLINTVKAFSQLGFRRRKHTQKTEKEKKRSRREHANPLGLDPRATFNNPFLFNNFVSSYPLGGQPTARISEHSLHTNVSARTSESEEGDTSSEESNDGSEMSQRHDSARDKRYESRIEEVDETDLVLERTTSPTPLPEAAGDAAQPGPSSAPSHSPNAGIPTEGGPVAGISAQANSEVNPERAPPSHEEAPISPATVVDTTNPPQGPSAAPSHNEPAQETSVSPQPEGSTTAVVEPIPSRNKGKERAV